MERLILEDKIVPNSNFLFLIKSYFLIAGGLISER